MQGTLQKGKLMNWKFWEKEILEQEKIVELPKPDEVWYLKGDDGSPWPNIMMVPATVLDVKEGWVRYKIGNGELFGDIRKTMKEFLFLYQKDVATPVVPKHKYSYEEWQSLYLSDPLRDDRGYAYPIVREAFEAGRKSVEM